MLIMVSWKKKKAVDMHAGVANVQAGVESDHWRIIHRCKPLRWQKELYT